MGGRIIGVKIIEVHDYGRYYLASELHSTKGWKAPFKNVVKRGQRCPYPGQYFPAGRAAKRGPFCDGSRLQPNRDLVAVRDPQGSTRHLQRHGWYQRQLRKEAANAQPTL